MTILPFGFYKATHICNRTKRYPGSIYKKSETMKRIFIAAVALSALCSSCETADQSFLDETNNTTANAQKTNSITNTDYDIYTTIVSSFVYANEETYAENLQQFEQHVNRLMPYDESEEMVYEAINWEQLTVLTNADENFMNELNYSPAFKEALYNLLYKETQTNTILESETENRLLHTLMLMHKENKGNGHDDKFNRKRTIAFAYGYQYSFKQAVLYAGAIELMSQKP